MLTALLGSPVHDDGPLPFAHPASGATWAAAAVLAIGLLLATRLTRH